jgi:hypothetical protein
MGDIIERIKLSLRISHSKLDTDIGADIAACLADLKMVGIVYKDESDPLIFNAVKLWCRSLYTDDPAKGAEYLNRYNALKASLMMAEGYGRPEETPDD